jgi:hypothetical protein
MHDATPRHDATAETPAAEVALLRALALAAAEAAAEGAALPDPLRDMVDAWLGADWLTAGPPDPDQPFTQGYLAAMEVAARNCSASAEAKAALRRSSFNPLRRHRLKQAERALGAMAATLRLMATGLQAHGR